MNARRPAPHRGATSALDRAPARDRAGATWVYGRIGAMQKISAAECGRDNYCGYLPLLEQYSLTLSINYFFTQPCPRYTPINPIQQLCNPRARSVTVPRRSKPRLRDPRIQSCH
eukprot:COSAG03_NODE_13860_length_485_cov_6.129534_1_plen_113_part_10